MELFKFVLYLLAALTSVACMVLLFFDFVVFPTQVDLRVYRLLAALAGVLFLLYAFIWETE